MPNLLLDLEYGHLVHPRLAVPVLREDRQMDWRQFEARLATRLMWMQNQQADVRMALQDLAAAWNRLSLPGDLMLREAADLAFHPLWEDVLADRLGLSRRRFPQRVMPMPSLGMEMRDQTDLGGWLVNLLS